MVDAEDIEFEKDILESGYHIAVPVQIEKKTSGELRIISYSFVLEKSREFEKQFGADPFTGEAFDFLDDNIGKTMAEMDFDYSMATERLFFEYRCNTPDKSKILPGCELIDTLEGVNYDESLELDAFELDAKSKIDRMAVMKDDEGKIICYAGLDDICENDGLLEVTVECAEDFRQRGYASSCVAMLTDYLLSIGEKVKYVCENENENSKKTALSAGYYLYKTVLPYVCYKEGRDGSEEDDDEDGCCHEHEHEHHHHDDEE